MANLHVTEKCLFNARNFISFHIKRTLYTNKAHDSKQLIRTAHINSILWSLHCCCRFSGMYVFLFHFLLLFFYTFLVSLRFISFYRFVYTCVYCVLSMLTVDHHTADDTVTRTHNQTYTHIHSQSFVLCCYLCLLYGESQS